MSNRISMTREERKAILGLGLGIVKGSSSIRVYESKTNNLNRLFTMKSGLGWKGKWMVKGISYYRWTQALEATISIGRVSDPIVELRLRVGLEEIKKEREMELHL